MRSCADRASPPPLARAGYVFASALVVTSLSFVWIFARRPLYPALRHQYSLLHMTPLFDQQLAGFVSKFCCYIPMWAIAFTTVSWSRTIHRLAAVQVRSALGSGRDQTDTDPSAAEIEPGSQRIATPSSSTAGADRGRGIRCADARRSVP